MYHLIQQLKEFSQRSLFKVDKRTLQPLLSNDEIHELLLRVQSSKISHSHKHDISFRKMGDVRSIYRGQGMDYEESRLYQVGDDPRYMNWQLSARTGQHYMKVFREERQPGVFILVDRRNAMRFGTMVRLKITQAARAAAIAAFTAQEKHYSIGGVILDNELEWFKENQNKQAIFDFIQQASRPAIPVTLQNQKIQQPNITDVLRTLNEVITKGSSIYLISDFHDLTEDNQATLLQLSTSHQVHAIHIIDPAELKLPKSGIVSLKSSTINKEFNIDTTSSTEQNNYQSSSDDYFYNIKKLFGNIAIPYYQLLTSDEDVENVTIAES